MPNLIDANGLTVKTLSEIVTQLKADFQSIYGADINLDSDTPDGQMLNIFAQAIIDIEDLLVQIYNGFDPDYAIGKTLDMRAAINGVIRLAGTNTLTNITVVTDRALNLVGYDDYLIDPTIAPYTVADNAGNQFYLAESQSIGAAGSYVFEFRAVNPGAVLTVPNTIVNQVTVVLGVISVNNPTVYTSLGIDEETDAALRVRRQKSVSISSQGYLEGLLAMLLNINGVTGAFVYENVTDTVDGDGIPGHSIWVIVQGGDSASIANAIYSKRNAGCGMKGSVTEVITQVDGTYFTVRWDIVVPQNLYIEFDATSINGVDTIDTTNIKNQLALLLKPDVFATVDINEVATLVQQIDPNCLVTNAGLSLSGGGPFTAILTPSAKNRQFAIIAANIDITVV